MSTHNRIFTKPLSSSEAWQFLKEMLDSPGFSLLNETDRHETVLEKIISQTRGLMGNLWHDAHTFAIMTEHGISEIVTTDTDFYRFSTVKVTNPFRKN